MEGGSAGGPRGREVGVEVHVGEVCDFPNARRTLLLQKRNGGGCHLGVVAACRGTASSRLGIKLETSHQHRRNSPEHYGEQDLPRREA